MARKLSRRRALKGVGAVFAGTSLAGCGGNGDDNGDPNGNGDGDGNTVEMTGDLIFDPDTLTVSVGDTVVWETVGSVGHTVTAYEDQIPDGAEYFASGGFDSQSAAEDGWSNGQEGNVATGETYEHTFQTAGTYEYYCIPHKTTMEGTITVEE